MRLPFLQLESDIIAHGAAEVSNLAGCSIPQALGHIALVRAWAVSHASDDAPPDGWVAGDSATRRIEAAAHWTGEKGALAQALIDAGHLSQEEGGIRVLGLEPYVTTWERNRRGKERVRNHRERNANVRVTHHDVAGGFREQTQTQKEDPASQEAAPPAAAVAAPMASQEAQSERPALVLQVQPGGKKPRQPSAAERAYHALQEQRRARCVEAGAAFVEDGWTPSRQNRDLGAIARLDPESEEAQRFDAAWQAYLADEGRAGMDVPWSLGYFLASRSTWEGRALKAAGGGA